MCKLTYFFLKHGGHIKCEKTGVNKYSKDLEQGWLEIPARLIISNANKRMTGVMKEKLKSTEKLTVNPNSFSIGCLIYYKLGCFICSFLAYCM